MHRFVHISQYPTSLKNRTSEPRAFKSIQGYQELLRAIGGYQGPALRALFWEPMNIWMSLTNSEAQPGSTVRALRLGAYGLRARLGRTLLPVYGCITFGISLLETKGTHS